MTSDITTPHNIHSTHNYTTIRQSDGAKKDHLQPTHTHGPPHVPQRPHTQENIKSQTLGAAACLHIQLRTHINLVMSKLGHTKKKGQGSTSSSKFALATACVGTEQIPFPSDAQGASPWFRKDGKRPAFSTIVITQLSVVKTQTFLQRFNLQNKLYSKFEPARATNKKLFGS